MDVDLGVLDPSEFSKVYDIMEEAFPPSELRPYEEAKELIDNPDYNVLLIKSRKGKLGGFLAFWDFTAFNFAEYFAIHSTMRGLGLGSAALKQFLKGETKPLILEVEACETKQAKRRIKFYERLGFILTDINYFPPPSQKGEEPIPLTIMSYPNDIPKAKKKHMLALISQHVYDDSALAFY